GTTLSIDHSPTHAACAQANLIAIGEESSIVHRLSSTSTIAVADVTRLRLRADAAFFDPSRRAAGRRVRRTSEYEPPLAFVHDILKSVPNLAVKVSPAIDDAEIAGLGGRMEFVSDRGECKEAVLWFGGIGPDSPRSAAVLPAGVSLQAMDVPPPSLSGPAEWLLEPDPAVV